ncbi:MAG: preprotein translocase subunit SecY [Candidatus Paceibacterota bacterium]|jgi:preprotein translocase subunit SecY
MSDILSKLKLVFRDTVLRKRIIITVVLLAVFRLLASIPIPGVDQAQLARFFGGSQFFGLLDIFSGGGLSNLSIVMIGVSPYITASIIMQLLTMMSPRLKALYQEEGEAGRKKFSQWSRLISVPLALLQAVGFIFLLEKQGVIVHLTSFDLAVNVIVVTTGSILLMWLGEIITEFGIGNGISLIIFSGIIASLPQAISQLIFAYDPSMLLSYIAFLVVAIAIIAAVVYITEAERPIPVTYAKRVRGNRVYGGISTYLPLRLNQAGVIPIIFALSILLFPQLILNVLQGIITDPSIQSWITTLLGFLANNWVYAVMYFLLVFVFTYFYTAVTFDPHQIAENLQKNGAFIPGVRPGGSTSEYIGKVLTRITLVGALFLGTIAVLPLVIKALMPHINSIAIGGTALLIAVSVILDLVKKVDAQISMREY